MSGTPERRPLVYHGAPELRPLVSHSLARAGATARRPAAFLDRDGVLDEGVPDPFSGALESPLRVEDVRLLPGVAAALRLLAGAGFVLVCVSNQPAAAKGRVTAEELRAVHERVLALLAREDAHLDASYLCLHHPDGVVPALSGPCPCRKPAPGMLLEAADALGLELDASWMFGDTDADVGAGAAAGCRTVLLEYPGSAHKRLGVASPDILAADLPGGVARLLEEDA